jgi:hypothetical protein
MQYFHAFGRRTNEGKHDKLMHWLSRSAMTENHRQMSCLAVFTGTENPSSNSPTEWLSGKMAYAASISNKTADSTFRAGLISAFISRYVFPYFFQNVFTSIHE